MKYYKSETGQVFAYEADGSQDAYIASNLVLMTLSEVEAHLNPQPTEQQLREIWKQQRAEAVAAIKVTTAAGNTFDGDELSQGRMARAILGLQAADSDTVTWVLADNTVIQATAEELQEALALAGAEQARLWILNSSEVISDT